MDIINFKKKKMKLLTKEQQESNKNAKLCYHCIEKIKHKHVKDKKHCKVRNHCHYTWECKGDEHSICNLKYSLPGKIPIGFHNESNYDYHFVKKSKQQYLKNNLLFEIKNK